MVIAKSIINVENLTKMIKFWEKKKRKRENAKKWCLSLLIINTGSCMLVKENQGLSDVLREE